jgi:hypothetical protein
MILKSLFYTAFLCLLALPTLADQTSCEISRANLLAEEPLEKLTLKVCPREKTTEADIHLEYEEMRKVKTSSDFLVYQYTDKCYKKINSELFKSTDQDHDVLKIAEQLDAVLCDYPMGTGEVFRGASLPDEALKKYLDSKEISFPAFSSSSKSFSVSCEFAKKGNTLFRMISKSGRLIGSHSKHSMEDEVIFRTNTRFRVINSMTGIQAAMISGCKGVSNYFELEEIYEEEKR